MKTNMKTRITDFTVRKTVAARPRRSTCREDLDCGDKSDATTLSHAGRFPDRVASSRTRKRRPRYALPAQNGKHLTPPRLRCSRLRFPIRVLRAIRGQLLLALLPRAWTLAGRAGAATLTVTNLADNGPGTLRQLIADSSPDDTLLLRCL
jgi:hypothetical protein